MPITKPPFSLREILKSLIVLEDFVTADECRRMVEIHQRNCPNPDVATNNTIWVLDAARDSAADGDFIRSIIQRITDVLLQETPDGARQGVDWVA